MFAVVFLLLVAAYVAVKYALYKSWCSYALKHFAPDPESKPEAGGFAATRMIAGVLVAYLRVRNFPAKMAAGESPEPDWPRIYASMLMVRWSLWSALATRVRWPNGGITILGADQREFGWRVAATTSSFLLDILLFLIFVAFTLWAGH